MFLSIAGISLISSIDFDSHNESVAGKYDKTPAEIMLGDGMALFGAFSYGVYTTLLKARVGHESRVSMQMFFGFVGLFNLLGLWPGLFLLHAMGVEKFQLPPDNRVWWIVAVSLFPPLLNSWRYLFPIHFDYIGSTNVLSRSTHLSLLFLTIVGHMPCSLQLPSSSLLVSA